MTPPTPILFVHYGEEWIRGSERCLLDLLEHLDRSRFAPVLWTNNTVLASRVEALDIPVRTSEFRILLDDEPPRFSLSHYAHTIREAFRIVREHGIRIIHANSGAPVQWMLPVSRAKRLPLLAHLHAPYSLRHRCAMGLTQVSAAVGPSTAVIAPLVEDGMLPARTHLVPNAVDLERFRVAVDPGLRAALGIPEGTVVVTGVGSLIRRKAFDVVIRAMCLLEKDRVMALIVGGGPEAEALRELALSLGSPVRFLGERGDIPAIFRSATDIVVSAARSEAFGLTLIEAGAAGLPVVAAAVDGVPEVVEQGETGLLVPAEDPGALAEAIGRLVHDEGLRKRMGQAGYRRAAEKYALERYVASLEALYGQLLSAPRSRYGWLGTWTFPSAHGRWVEGVLRRRLGLSQREAPR